MVSTETHIWLSSKKQFSARRKWTREREKREKTIWRMETTVWYTHMSWARRQNNNESKLKTARALPVVWQHKHKRNCIVEALVLWSANHNNNNEFLSVLVAGRIASSYKKREKFIFSIIIVIWRDGVKSDIILWSTHFSFCVRHRFHIFVGRIRATGASSFVSFSVFPWRKSVSSQKKN